MILTPGEMTFGELASKLGRIPQSTLSSLLRELVIKEILAKRIAGKNTFYRIISEDIRFLLMVLSQDQEAPLPSFVNSPPQS